MDQQTVEKTLRFLISKLSEADLREFDDLMVGTSLDVPTDLGRNVVPAMDAAPGSPERKAYLGIGPTGRKSIRAARTASIRGYRGVAQDSAPAKSAISIRDESMFPDAKRLRGY